METEKRSMQYPFLMAGGLSGLGVYVAEELIRNILVNEPGFKWDAIFSLMREKGENSERPDALIPCHLMCANRAPSTYSNLAQRVLEYAFSRYEQGMRFNEFCQYSIIGVLKAGALLQLAHQGLIGNDFEVLLATFIQSTMLPGSGHAAYSWRKEEPTLDLMDAAMKDYFRPTDHIAKTALQSQLPRLLLSLHKNDDAWTLVANTALQDDGETSLGPGAAMFRSLVFALLDYEHRKAPDLFKMLGVLNPLRDPLS